MSHQDQQRRQDYLEWLYVRAGRSDGLYTGLFQQRQQELIAADMRRVVWWRVLA